jgi:hypothetical protein
VAKISPVTFVTNFDAIESFALVAALVLLAEGEIRGTTNEFLSRTIITRTGLKDEEAHVAFIDGKNVIEAAAKLLQKDPKGFLLVDEAVRKLKGKDSPLPRLSGIYNGKLRIKNFVIAGAEAGAALYKQLYALCPPPKIPLKPVT